MEVNDINVLEVLHKLYPNGDTKFVEMMYEEMELYNRKNYDYAAGIAGQEVNPNGNFDRVAAWFAMYPGISLSDARVVCLSYIMKQLDQVAWSLSRGFEGKVEGLDPRLQDIAVYTNILRVINARMLEAEESGNLICTDTSSTIDTGNIKITMNEPLINGIPIGLNPRGYDPECTVQYTG